MDKASLEGDDCLMEDHLSMTSIAVMLSHPMPDMVSLATS